MRIRIVLAATALAMLSACHRQTAQLPIPVPRLQPIHGLERQVRLLTDTSDLRALKHDVAEFLDRNTQFMPDEVESIRALQKQIAAISASDSDFDTEVDDAEAAFESIRVHHRDVLDHVWS